MLYAETEIPTEDCWIVTNMQEGELNAKNTDLAREKARICSSLEIQI